MTFLYHLFCFFILSVQVDLSPHKNQCRQSNQDQQSCHQKLRSSCQHSSNIRIYNRCRKLSYTSCHKKRYKRHRSKSCCITYNIKRNKRKQTTDQNCILSIFFNKCIYLLHSSFTSKLFCHITSKYSCNEKAYRCSCHRTAP